MAKSPDIIEETRQQVAEYEQVTTSAQTELEAFEAENGEKLEALKAEFEDYSNHPLWQEHNEKAAAIVQPREVYVRWHSDKLNESGDLDGWEATVIFHGEPAVYYGRFKPDDPERSMLPPSMAELDRRVTIAQHLGQVAAMLRDHAGEPIISIADYRSSLVLKTTDGAKAKIDDRYGYYNYRDGRIDDITKTRVVIGSIGDTDGEPVLELGDSNDERTTAGQELRIALANSVTGIVTAYSLPSYKAQLQRLITPPHVTKRREFRHYKFVDLPIGNIELNDMPFSEAIGQDLLVIDGSHQTVADYAFPDDVTVYRPKQKVERQQTRDQEIMMTVADGEERRYEATVVSAEGSVTLPAPRHNTLWLVGNEAIEKGLADGIFCNASPASRNRLTPPAILQAARDLVEFASSGKSAAELAA